MAKKSIRRIKRSRSRLSWQEKARLAGRVLRRQGYKEDAIALIIRLAFGDDPAGS